jgi:hypothetical protein
MQAAAERVECRSPCFANYLGDGDGDEPKTGLKNLPFQIENKTPSTKSIVFLRERFSTQKGATTVVNSLRLSCTHSLKRLFYLCIFQGILNP